MEASTLQIRSFAGSGRFIGRSSFHRRHHQMLNPYRAAFGSPSPKRNRFIVQWKSGMKRSNGIVASTSKFQELKPDQVNDKPDQFSDLESSGEELGTDKSREEEIFKKHKGTAKLHDFCLGIPFGGFVFGGGLVGFMFTRNLAVLSTGVLLGGAILALSTCSLKVWKQGKSSLPFILGQAAFAGVLLVKNFQTYAMTKKLFPTGIYVFFSAAMLCFYFYVMISGGNPPPKKSKLAATTAAA